MTKLLHIRNTTSGVAPVATNLTVGQLAINTADATLFTLSSTGVVKKIADATILANTLTTVVANTYGIIGTSATITNIDTQFNTGFYYAASTASGTFPTATGAVNCCLQVINNGAVTGVVQVLTSLGATFDGTLYMRRYLSGAWSTWIASYNTLNIGNQLIRTINGQSPTTAGDITVTTTRNKIINGRFRMWQRPIPAAGAIAGFIADRWYMFSNGATVSQGTSTSATDFYYLIWQETAGTGTPYISQSMNDVTLLAGQTTTFSILANPSKAMTITPSLIQNFGTSGSATVTTNGTPISLAAGTWGRYTFTFTAPSIAGKTVGANSYSRLQIATAVTPGTFTLNLSEVQWELGPNFMGYEFEDISTTTQRCLYYYEVNNGALCWSGQIGLGQQPNLFVPYAYKRTVAPALTFSSVVASNMGTGNPTLITQTNQGAKLQLTAGTLTLGGFGYYNFNMIADSELGVT